MALGLEASLLADCSLNYGLKKVNKNVSVILTINRIPRLKIFGKTAKAWPLSRASHTSCSAICCKGNNFPDDDRWCVETSK